jgi:hypothetical protein
MTVQHPKLAEIYDTHIYTTMMMMMIRFFIYLLADPNSEWPIITQTTSHQSYLQLLS